MALTKRAYVYIGMLVFIVLVVLRVLPLHAGLLVILYVLLFDRRSLRVDYALLATFACFFGFVDNLQMLFSNMLTHSRHVFMLSALLSQVISNVPTALLLADFTEHWQALSWVVSVGGFGSLVASLANLIASRIFLNAEKSKAKSFTLKFHLLSYAVFFVGTLLYYLRYIAR